ncbi:MAG TPA: hypothetical protein VL307_03205 [Chitinophagaceae bacterium]|nr:hypothetical protein [Chitinophagaceae bacterium]
MQILFLVTLAAVIYSYTLDKSKTIAGIRSGLTMFLNILPAIFVLMLFISILLFLLPAGTISAYLGAKAGFSAYIIAAVIGSVALIPSFIAYPLAGVLLKNGVSYQVMAVFISTLLMVGVITLPLEARYFGWKIAIWRNVLYFIGALGIGLLIGLIM